MKDVVKPESVIVVWDVSSEASARDALQRISDYYHRDNFVPFPPVFNVGNSGCLLMCRMSAR